MIRTIVIDDHSLMRRGIVDALQENEQINVIAEGCNGSDVTGLLREYSCDVLVVDLQMPQYTEGSEPFLPIDTLQTILGQYKETTVVVVTQENSIQTLQSLAEIGVQSIVSKTDALTTSLGSIVESVFKGGRYFSPEVVSAIKAHPLTKVDLSPREIEVLNVVVNYSHLSREEQVAILNITKSTLYFHLKRIREALNVESIEAMIIQAIRRGLVEIDT